MMMTLVRAAVSESKLTKRRRCWITWTLNTKTQTSYSTILMHIQNMVWLIWRIGRESQQEECDHEKSSVRGRSNQHKQDSIQSLVILTIKVETTGGSARCKARPTLTNPRQLTQSVIKITTVRRGAIITQETGKIEITKAKVLIMSSITITMIMKT